MKLSIFIPVFRESEHLEKLIKNLLSDSFKDKEIFVISPSSPIGKLLLGKVIGEAIYFKGKQIEILEIL